jgi:copper homeostasis protein CutC
VISSIAVKRLLRCEDIRISAELGAQGVVLGVLRSHHVGELLTLDIKEIHTASRTKIPSPMTSRAFSIQMGTDDHLDCHLFVDAKAIQTIVEAVGGEQSCSEKSCAY